MRPLEDIEGGAAAATEGPWERDDETVQCVDGGWVVTTDTGGDHEAAMDQIVADLDFIASARTDVPDLCAEVRRLRALLAECKPQLHRPPQPGLLTHEAQRAAERAYADRIERIDSALGIGAVPHPMGGDDGSGPTSGGAP